MERHAKLLMIIGMLVTAVWASHIPWHVTYWPFGTHQGVHQLVQELDELEPWLKEMGGVEGRTAAEMERSIMTELQGGWIRGVAFMVLGMFAGVSLARRKRYGHILVLGTAGWCVIGSLVSIVRRYPHILGTFRLHFEHRPIEFIHGYIVLAVQIVAIVCLIVLARRRRYERTDLATDPNGA